MNLLWEKRNPSIVLLLITVFFSGVSFLIQDGWASPIQLAYDTGDAENGNIGEYCGVRFSMPPGVADARLVMVRFMALSTGGVSNQVTVHMIDADRMTKLIPPMTATIITSQKPSWYDVELINSNIVVSKDFYVIIHTPHTVVFGDNGPSSGRSFYGSSLDTLTTPNGVSNIIIRAIIEPIAPPQTEPTFQRPESPVAPTVTVTTTPPSATVAPQINGSLTVVLTVVIIALLAILAGYIIGKRKTALTCPNCGHTIAEDTKFCPECGKSVGARS